MICFQEQRHSKVRGQESCQSITALDVIAEAALDVELEGFAEAALAVEIEELAEAAIDELDAAAKD